MRVAILGISAYYHDSAAAIVIDGKIIAAAQEERFTRVKHDAQFPTHAVKFCLEHTGIDLRDIRYIVFYDKPLIKFERLLESYIAYAPKGFKSFVRAMPVWIKEKLYLKTILKKKLAQLAEIKIAQLPPLLFTEHHQAHATSAFFPSPFEQASVLCLDGVGEWATTSVWSGKGNTLIPEWEIKFPHSLGLLYSAFTYYTGFKVNSGEYKLMGLAPYGEPKYVDVIMDNIIDIKPDGTFRLDMSYFNYVTGLEMTSHKFHRLFGGEPRIPETRLSRKEMDLACSIQRVTEEVILKLAKGIKADFGSKYLCLAGGVALNCVANGHLLRAGLFDDIWIQPAAGDSGGALGAALAVWYQYMNKPRVLDSTDEHDAMRGSLLGPLFSNKEVESRLRSMGAVYESVAGEKLAEKTAELLAAGNIIGWFQGAMEFGPRALGARSILGDPRNPEMQSIMNLKIKFRESFRPFAPAILAEKVGEWFDHETPTPYMLLVTEVKQNKRLDDQGSTNLSGIDKLQIIRSQIPAVTHVDYSARVQTVHQTTNPRFYHLLEKFNEKTGCPILINTSFNVRGEPIVCTPEDAYRCFMGTEMDYLVIENLLLDKAAQPASEHVMQQSEFRPD